MALHNALALVGFLAFAANAADYSFTSRDAVVKLTVDFLPAYTGSRLSIYSGSKEVPLSGETGFAGTPERFVGAGAMVTYSVQYTGRQRKRGVVRERVVLLGQSDGLPERPAYEKTVKLVKGVASDLQLFGYDEGALAEGERAAAREQAKGFWRRFRQELFLDDEKEPFAVLEWTHTVSEIRLFQGGAGGAACQPPLAGDSFTASQLRLRLREPWGSSITASYAGLPDHS